MSAEQPAAIRSALRLRVRGLVQGVGFRPYVSRLAAGYALTGWVRNDGDGVDVHVEGIAAELSEFSRSLEANLPPLARIESIEEHAVDATGASAFEIRESRTPLDPTVPVAPDAAICTDCLAELRDPANRRYRYPFITCTNCGPRYSIVLSLPYDRRRTTMEQWEMCDECRREYESAGDRRFHAQPIACPTCGPHCRLERIAGGTTPIVNGDAEVVTAAALLLSQGAILGVKGVGGYHLVCDARNVDAVRALRERKFRKERPFALMARSVGVATSLVDLSPDMLAVLASPVRPIVLAPARERLESVAPQSHDLGVMLPYAPLHHLLFDAGAPDVLVMTSGNKSSEPIAYCDESARERLVDLADALLVGERPIARRLDDSIVQQSVFGPIVLRRARGYAPAVVARLETAGPMLAVGGDLKSAVALAVGGHVIGSQHLGDLEHVAARDAFDLVIADLLAMYRVELNELTVVHDSHPGYVSAACAKSLGAARQIGVQHHRAHIASVVAERGEPSVPIIGVAFDGTGWGDDGTIWGGEFFAGSLAAGLTRVAHLREARLPGGDAAARHPVQAAAGFLAQLDTRQDLSGPPFDFGPRFEVASRLLASNLQSFTTTSVGRLFDTVAAIAGFTRRVTFEGQAAIWLEQVARAGHAREECRFDVTGREIDYRPALRDLIGRRRKGESPADLALAFHAGFATAVAMFVEMLRQRHPAEAIVLSGGVFQNRLLLELLAERLPILPVWTAARVPPNDGGLALGQLALAAVAAR